VVPLPGPASKPRTRGRHVSVDETAPYLLKLRASQINGCAADMHLRELRAAGEPGLFTLATWRETPYFGAAERTPLALRGRPPGWQIAPRKHPHQDPAAPLA
jgi:AhpD family alkylhydroperoxidase